MDKKPKHRPSFPLDLPEPDPEAMAEAARRFLQRQKPPGGWKQGRETRNIKAEGDGE